MSKRKKEVIRRSFTAAFPYTIPIMTGFLFLGISYGVYAVTSGFSAWYPIIMSATIFAGSMEFVAVGMLLGTFNPLAAFAMTLMINARHIFYGVSMLDKYNGCGKKKIYLIFGLCDESFSINYSVKIPPDCDKGWFMFFVTILNQLYWVTGATLGAIFGSFIRFNTDGLEFVMTAMFAVIFIGNFMEEKNHFGSFLGIAASLICLLIFGADNFIVPSMLLILITLTALRNPMEKLNEKEDAKA